MTLTATPTNPILVYYCKAGIQTGQTVRVLQSGQVHQTSGVELTGAWATMRHDNSSGRAKRSGARCVLILNRGTVTFPA